MKLNVEDFADSTSLWIIYTMMDVLSIVANIQQCNFKVSRTDYYREQQSYTMSSLCSVNLNSEL